MPSFYPSYQQRQLPLTPPEHFGFYNNTSGSFCTPSMNSYGTSCNDFRYGSDGQNPSIYGKQPYANRGSYPDHVPGFSSALERRENVYGTIAPPILPPIRIPESAMKNQAVHQTLPAVREQAVAEPKEEKPAGGVAAHLDYEMEQMIDFVAEMAQGMYDLFESRLCLADVDLSRSVQSGSSVSASFRTYVSQILTSTRLPSSTLMLALHYLATRMTMLSSQGVYTSSTGHLYHMLTTALMLASKFLDDNTFQNRSWAEVSHIAVTDLNKHEMEWLVDIGWDLHFDPTDIQGFNGWIKQWERWQAKKVQLSMEALKLTAMDNMRMQQSAHKYSPPTPLYTPPFSGSSFNFGVKDRSSSHWQQWPPIRTLSPPSANPSGPTTPEWYAKHSIGNFGQGPHNYSSRPLPPLHLAPGYNWSPYYGNMSSHYSASSWGGHGVGCGCGCCSFPQDSHSMAHSYGIQPVAG